MRCSSLIFLSSPATTKLAAHVEMSSFRASVRGGGGGGIDDYVLLLLF